MSKVFKSLAAIVFAAFAAATLSACDKTDDPTPTPLTFTVAKSDLISTGVTIEITPSDATASYYFDVLATDIYNNVKEAGFQTFFNSEIERRMAAMSASREEALAKMLSKGVDNFTYKSLTAQTDYYIVVFGADAAGNIVGEPYAEPFSTPAVDPSKNELTISVSNVATDGADYAVKASVADDMYFADIWSKSLVDELGDEAFMNYCIEYNGFYMDVLSTSGDFELANEHVCQPGRDYYVVAFGYNKGFPTTKLFKKEFTTVGGDPKSCTFKYDFSEYTSSSVKIKVTPSDKKTVYIWNVTATYRIDELMAGGKTKSEAFSYVLNYLIDASVKADGLYRQQVVETMGRWSGFTTSDPEGYDVEKISGLDPGSYYVWAVCVDALGNPLGDFAYEQFTIKAD